MNAVYSSEVRLMESISSVEETVTTIECCRGGVTKVLQMDDSELVRLLDKLFAIAITKAVVESFKESRLQAV
jgi:hypothetical protein